MWRALSESNEVHTAVRIFWKHIIVNIPGIRQIDRTSRNLSSRDEEQQEHSMLLKTNVVESYANLQNGNNQTPC